MSAAGFRSTTLYEEAYVPSKKHVQTRPDSVAVVGNNVLYESKVDIEDRSGRRAVPASTSKEETEKSILSFSGAPLSPNGRAQLKRPDNYGPGGPTNVRLGSANVTYECGIKEAQMRSALDPSLRELAENYPTAGTRPVPRERQNHIPIGGPDHIPSLWNHQAQVATESLALAQMRVAYDPRAMEEAERLPTAGGRVEQKWLGQSIRTTRPVGGNKTFDLTWEESEQKELPPFAMAGRRSGGAGLKIGEEPHELSAYTRPGSHKPRDSMGGIMGRDQVDQISGRRSDAYQSGSDSASRAGYEAAYAKKALLKPDQLVGGRSAPYLDDAAQQQFQYQEPAQQARAPVYQPSQAYVPSAGHSPSARAQPLGGRSLLSAGLKGLDDPSPAVGARVVSRQGVSSQITF